MRHEYLISDSSGLTKADLSAAAQLLFECANARALGRFIPDGGMAPVGHLFETDRELTQTEREVIGVTHYRTAA